MSQSTLFSSGFQLAPFVTSSGLLRLSWDAITTPEPGSNSKVGAGLSWKLHSVSFHEKDLKIIAFETIPLSQHHVEGALVSSSDLKKKNFLDFDFLSTKNSPPFYVNSTAVTLLHENRQILDELKTEIDSSTILIVTGRALAGSVASLFALSLLDTIGSGKNRPLCITFGSPLIGDRNLQQAVSRSPNWYSCFLHVVFHKDPLPRLFISSHSSPAAATSPQSIAYMPFGTFLLCSDVGSTSSVNPDSILELLVAMGSTHVQNQGFQPAEYGNIVDYLYRKAICKDLITQAENIDLSDSLLERISLQLGTLGLTPHTQAENIDLSDSLLASISLQLLALGLTPHTQQRQQNNGVNILKNMKELEVNFSKKSSTSFDPFKKLNIVKKDMAQLEWYKKKTKSQGIGYYDSYRNMYSSWDQDVKGYKKSLTMYWEKMVEEAEMKPQKEEASFRTRWLFAGTNYRRMVEPLIIAEFYKDGRRDYVTKNRPKHFEKLEEWLREGNPKDTSSLNSTSKHNVESILTLDSCFWAHVEEALLSCKELKVTKKEEARNKLLNFEEYVYELLRNYAVSPEIFLPKTSYMRWWAEYKEIKGRSYDSKLASFMSNARNYEQYAVGAMVLNCGPQPQLRPQYCDFHSLRNRIAAAIGCIFL